MSASSSSPWPPPPDLESIQDLVREADIEGLIAIHGAPADEYEPEGEELFAAIKHLSTTELVAFNLLPILEPIWRKNFTPDDDELALRRPALQKLSEEIARFFGPDARPQVRS